MLLGDSVHALPILGGEGANEAIGYGMELGEHVATRGDDGFRDFLERRYATWQRSISESEGRLRDMHELSRSAILVWPKESVYFRRGNKLKFRSRQLATFPNSETIVDI